MLINVKIIGGDGCALNVDPNITISQLKNLVEKSLKVSGSQQKLLLRGKPLSDEKQLSSYEGIEEGCKLNLLINRDQSANRATSSVESQPPKNVLNEEIVRFLRSYFKESDVERIAAEYMKGFNSANSQYNLDDWERIATHNLNLNH